MVTGYEVHMYAHIERIAKALERIADSLEETAADELVARLLLSRTPEEE